MIDDQHPPVRIGYGGHLLRARVTPDAFGPGPTRTPLAVPATPDGARRQEEINRLLAGRPVAAHPAG